MPDRDQWGFREEMAVNKQRGIWLLQEGGLAEGGPEQPALRAVDHSPLPRGCILLSTRHTRGWHLALALAILSPQIPFVLSAQASGLKQVREPPAVTACPGSVSLTPHSDSAEELESDSYLHFHRREKRIREVDSFAQGHLTMLSRRLEPFSPPDP